MKIFQRKKSNYLRGKKSASKIYLFCGWTAALKGNWKAILNAPSDPCKQHVKRSFTQLKDSIIKCISVSRRVKLIIKLSAGFTSQRKHQQYDCIKQARLFVWLLMNEGHRHHQMKPNECRANGNCKCASTEMPLQLRIRPEPQMMQMFPCINHDSSLMCTYDHFMWEVEMISQSECLYY